ncbi:MAG: FKBP-type peptidyl-prolyl cis-trans isomerase [Propionibacteriaceae bacterium]|nr:FKBP-type peptidyl-prolyl cis-trans isomerase [Propionibacteriaceae bacterium]
MGVALVGCQSTTTASPSASPSDVPSSTANAAAGDTLLLGPATGECTDALAGLTYEVEDNVPVLKFPGPISVDGEVSCVLNDGTTGEAFQEGDYVLYSAAEYDSSGTLTGSSFGGETQTGQIQPSGAGDLVSDALIGKKAGAVIVLAYAYEEVTYVMVLEALGITTAPPETTEAETPATTETRAWGEPNPEVNKDIPAVSLADSGEPSITTVAGDPPSELVVHTLLIGDGPAVTADQTVTVQYSGWLWDGTPFDSSWSSGAPVSFGLDQVIEGWTVGLEGQTVGSQVELVIPPAMGYGDSGSGSIPGGATLVFVVDILAAA